MHETIFCQKTEVFSSNLQFTCRTKFSDLGRFLHFSQKVVGVIMTLTKTTQILANRRLINKKYLENLKNPIVLQIFGREIGKVEGSVGKLSQNALFSTCLQKDLYLRGVFKSSNIKCFKMNSYISLVEVYTLLEASRLPGMKIVLRIHCFNVNKDLVTQAARQLENEFNSFWPMIHMSIWAKFLQTCFKKLETS